MIPDPADLVPLSVAAADVGKSPHNIRDYIQRGRIGKYDPRGNPIANARHGELRVSLAELRAFLGRVDQGHRKHWRDGLEPELAFDQVPEHERTRHVHRLHPYLGKFIPQLAEWFLRRYFRPNDIVLDPFMGSGTTLVQGNEMKMHTIGIDVSPFNCLIARVKTAKYDVQKARQEILDAERRTTEFSRSITAKGLTGFEGKEASEIADRLVRECQSEYLKTWFAPRALAEMLFYRSTIPDYTYQDLLKVLLSRAARSSRRIPHYDLATPKSPLPIGREYWCRKHKRYCRPIEECLVKIHAYGGDTLRRIQEFDRLRSDCASIIVCGDSRQVELGLTLENSPMEGRKIDGIFTSPPYVGQIDYHEQHRYAYELFGLARHDSEEIGPKRRGKSLESRGKYVEGIVAVLRKLLPYLKNEARILIVANDRFRLYAEIADRAGLVIEREFCRAVTKRTEQGDDPYQESIFVMTKRA